MVMLLFVVQSYNTFCSPLFGSFSFFFYAVSEIEKEV